ncbi:hypothetical protein L0664_04555 [Octadecabacter sp. G9-8]|uniref:Calcium-binding protein n=1 Tax=Octadecabacter dasysiphoniae TaxID=2909341 RepID=A0ABS9CT23_9RHOB|nr:calcium-binding protein [Octadecabacter dasysiphoniae]MCF2870328.1 hypothetical protein [Octadecabacter dasysiphoniae]
MQDNNTQKNDSQKDGSNDDERGGNNGTGQGGKGNNDTIDLTDIAGADDVDLDLGAAQDGVVIAQIDNNGDDTVDETVEIDVDEDDDITVIGTDGDNVFAGGAGDDVIVGSAGDDAVTGGDGDDTIDYSDLNAGVTISSAGVIDKGDLGTDTVGEFDVEAGTIEVVETVVANEDQTNVVDSTSVQGAVAIDIDLDEGTFIGNIVENAGDFQAGEFFAVTLENFDDVLGSDNDDQITGDGQANLLTGAAGTDIINGASGNDTINGGTGSDTLTGGDGEDTFVFALADGADTITDFDVGADVLEFADFAASDVTTSTEGGDTTLSYGDSELVLEGVVEEDLSGLLMIA